MDGMGKKIEYIDNNTNNSTNGTNETSSNEKEMKGVKLRVVVDDEPIAEETVEPTAKQYYSITSTNEIVRVKIYIDGLLAKQPYIEINLNNADNITKIQ